MANDVVNIVTILGDSIDVQEVMNVLIDRNKRVTFKVFAPIPQDIRCTSSPIRIVEQEVYDNHIIKMVNGTVTPLELRTPPITEEMRLDLLTKYGVDNWRGWSLKYWGTSQNAMEGIILGKNKVRFYTDNNCPYEAFNTLSKMFPSVKIKLQWADEDLGYNVGEIFIQDGVVIDSKAPKGGSDDAYEMAMIITEDKFYITGFLYSIKEDEMDEEFPSMCIRLAFKFRVVDALLPLFILNKFEEWAVKLEDYEFASEITKLNNIL